MKNTILRILIIAGLFALAAVVIVLITGLVSGWKTFIQFSDGFFWAGAILMSLGFLNALSRSSSTSAGPEYKQAAGVSESDARFKLWQANTFQGYRILAILGLSGLLMLGLSGLALLARR
jgi:hypothetical protein